MEEVNLRAELREQLRKGAARQLRKKGFIPSILYGPKTKPMPLTLNPREIRDILSKGLGTNVLINLHIGEGGHEDVKTVMIKEYQLDSIKGNLIHADLYEVSMDEKIAVTVPIQIVGKAPGVEKGGSVSQVLREVEVVCLPKEIPERFDVDISNLDMGDSIHVEDLVEKEGIEILTDKKAALVTVVAPMAAELEAEELEAEEEKEEEEVEAETAKPETKE